MIYSGVLNVAIFLAFLKRLVRDATRKVFLIVDNIRVHHAKAVTAWAEGNKAKIELFCLPAYAPQHNPDEYLNNDVKQGLARRQTPKDKAAMKAALTSYMRGLQKRPEKVKAFFQAETVRYAARVTGPNLRGGLIISTTYRSRQRAMIRSGWALSSNSSTGTYLPC